jgi:hypothetical protein
MQGVPFRAAEIELAVLEMMGEDGSEVEIAPEVDVVAPETGGEGG